MTALDFLINVALPLVINMTLFVLTVIPRMAALDDDNWR